MAKTVLMTGVTGYLGSRLVRTLLDHNYSIVALKRKTSSLHCLEPILRNITMYDVEGLDFSVPFKAHGNVHAVIHLATCYGRKDESVSQIVNANTVFPIQLLQAAITAGVTTFLNTDTALAKDLNSYSLSKKQFMEWGRYFANEKQIRFLNVRLQHFFGPGEHDTKFTTWVINSCLTNQPVLKLTRGEQKRDFIYIDDVVAAYLVLLEQQESLPNRFSEFDVGSGEAVSIKGFVEMAHRLTGSSTFLDFGAVPYRDGEVMFAQANTERLRQLGWSPVRSLESGLELTIKDMKV